MNNLNSNQNDFVEFSLDRWRDGFLRTVLYITSGIGLIGILIYVFTSHNPVFTFAAIGFYLVLLAFTFIPMIYYARAGFFVLLLNLIALFTLLDSGIRGSAIIFYLAISVVSTLVYENKTAFGNTILNCLIISLVGWLTLSGRIVLFSGASMTGTASTWIQSIVYYALLATLILSGIRLLKKDFLQAQGQANRLLDTLKVEQSNLAGRVSEATRNLTLAAEVGRSVTQVHDLDTLLNSAVDLIQEGFGLYYTQVYLLDPTGRQLILRAGTGAVGQQLRERHHSLAVDLASLNGATAVEKKPIVVENTEVSTSHRPNPLLPDTRSEMVVPLMVGERVVGTLDMQSSQAGALNKESLVAFEALAGQLAIAVENATLLAETEAARAEVEVQSHRLIRTGWEDFLNGIERGEKIGYTYDLENMAPYTQDVSAEPDARAMLTPIPVSGEPVGLFKFENEQGWDKDDAALVASVARQLGQQVENLRLLGSAEHYRLEAEEASRRLTREGWKEYVDKQLSTGLDYLYDLNEVKPATLEQQLAADKSAFRFPLKVRDETIGQLDVQGLDTADSDAVELANAVAERLGVHIEGLRQFDQAQSALAQSEKLFAASRSLTQAVDLQGLVNAAVSTLDIPSINRAVLATFKYDQTDNLEGMDIIANWWNGTGLEVAAIGTHYTLEVIRVMPMFISPTPVFFSDAFNDERVDDVTLQLVKRQNLQAVAVLPLHLGSRQIGAMILEGEEPHSFSKDETRLFSALAPQISTVLENRRQYERAQKQAERESTLNIISQKIQSATTVEAVLQIAARELGHALGAPLTIAQLGMKD